MEPASYKLGWAKLYENNNLKTDDVTLYVAEVQFAPTKAVKLGATFNFLQDDSQKYVSTSNLPFPTDNTSTNKKQVYTLGVDGAFNAGPAIISGFALYQFGKVDFIPPSVASDVDIAGYAVDLRADMNLGPGKFFIEGIYISGDSDDSATADYKSIITLNDTAASPGGPSFFARTDMMILLPNADDINTNTALIGAAADPGASLASFDTACLTSLGNCGRGIWHIGTGFTMPLGKQLTAKVGAGYLEATEKLNNADVNRKGTSMGTEVNAYVNYNIMKGLDFGLYGAYAFLGDYYESNLAGASDPDDVYDVHFRLNYAF
jgi:hypothetical protein